MVLSQPGINCFKTEKQEQSILQVYSFTCEFCQAVFRIFIHKSDHKSVLFGVTLDFGAPIHQVFPYIPPAHLCPESTGSIDNSKEIINSNALRIFLNHSFTIYNVHNRNSLRFMEISICMASFYNNVNTICNIMTKMQMNSTYVLVLLISPSFW